MDAFDSALSAIISKKTSEVNTKVLEREKAKQLIRESAQTSVSNDTAQSTATSAINE